MVCSPILGEGPGAGVTWAHEEKAAACHTSGKPHASVRWRGAGGGHVPQRASHLWSPGACSDQGGSTEDFWSQNNPAFMPELYSLVIV